MIKAFVDYLGKPAATLLEAEPFKLWPFEKSFEDELREFHYEFPRHGLALRCDEHENIKAIFLFADKYGGFDESLLEIPFSTKRQRVIEIFGAPSKSGGKTNHRVLGEHGVWDRFDRPGHKIHFEYRVDADRIKMITIFRGG